MSKKYNFKLVQISTDHVYKGKKFKLNSERGKLFAVNKYAKSKILDEDYLKSLKKYLIIRTNFTGKKKNTFINSVIKSIRNKKIINLFHDMYTSTLDVKTCANIIVKLCLLRSKGIYNLGSRDMVSKERFAIGIAKIMKKRIKFKSLSCQMLNVPRGKNLGLNVNKIEKKLGFRMPTSNKSMINLVEEYK